MRAISSAFALLLPTVYCALLPRHGNDGNHGNYGNHGWNGAPSDAPTSSSVWDVSNFDSLIVFGDSYSDESRLGYFISHNGSAPPPGTLLPESYNTASGGRTWPRYVVQYTGDAVNNQWTPQITLYDYAVSGAVCSNEITPRTLSIINADFPSVLEYEVPAFMADKSSLRIGTTEPYFTPALTASNAVYAIWIGTNDLGVWAFLTDSQVPGKVLSDYTSCIYAALDQLYSSGGRNFVLFNNAPLQLAPLYANDSLGGVGPNGYWPQKPANKTQIAETMHEYTTSTNTIFKYQTPFEARIAQRYPGANFANFDVWRLISDIYDAPEQYLNGTQPANASGFERHCDLNRQNCVDEYGGGSPDSFLWFDELHPSEQADRIIARNFVDVLNGNSSYATYW